MHSSAAAAGSAASRATPKSPALSKTRNGRNRLPPASTAWRSASARRGGVPLACCSARHSARKPSTAVAALPSWARNCDTTLNLPRMAAPALNMAIVRCYRASRYRTAIRISKAWIGRRRHQSELPRRLSKPRRRIGWLRRRLRCARGCTRTLDANRRSWLRRDPCRLWHFELRPAQTRKLTSPCRCRCRHVFFSVPAPRLSPVKARRLCRRLRHRMPSKSFPSIPCSLTSTRKPPRAR